MTHQTARERYQSTKHLRGGVEPLYWREGMAPADYFGPGQQKHWRDSATRQSRRRNRYLNAPARRKPWTRLPKALRRPSSPAKHAQAMRRAAMRTGRKAA